jgi:hypothetical protein
MYRAHYVWAQYVWGSVCMTDSPLLYEAVSLGMTSIVEDENVIEERVINFGLVPPGKWADKATFSR